MVAIQTTKMINMRPLGSAVSLTVATSPQKGNGSPYEEQRPYLKKVWTGCPKH